MTHSEQINEIAAAIAKAQGAFPALTTDAKAEIRSDKGANFSYKYATLANVLDVVRKTLSENGVAVLQDPHFKDSRLTIETLLVHTSGQWFRSDLTFPVAQMTPQGLGGVITYLRRYALSSLLGIAPDDDDDAQSATDAAKANPPRQQPTPERREPRNNEYNAPDLRVAEYETRQESAPDELDHEAPAEPKKPNTELRDALAAKCEEVDFIGNSDAKTQLVRILEKLPDNLKPSSEQVRHSITLPNHQWFAAINVLQGEPAAIVMSDTDAAPVVAPSDSEATIGAMAR